MFDSPLSISVKKLLSAYLSAKTDILARKINRRCKASVKWRGFCKDKVKFLLPGVQEAAFAGYNARP
jgi:hypothetical protein